MFLPDYLLSLVNTQCTRPILGRKQTIPRYNASNRCIQTNSHDKQCPVHCARVFLLWNSHDNDQAERTKQLWNDDKGGSSLEAIGKIR